MFESTPLNNGRRQHKPTLRVFVKTTQLRLRSTKKYRVIFPKILLLIATNKLFPRTDLPDYIQKTIPDTTIQATQSFVNESDQITSKVEPLNDIPFDR